MHPVGEVCLELNGPDSTVEPLWCIIFRIPWHEIEVEIVERGWDRGFPRKDRCWVHSATQPSRGHTPEFFKQQMRTTLETQTHPYPC